MFQCWDVLFWDVLIMGSYYREMFGICVSRIASTVVMLNISNVWISPWCCIGYNTSYWMLEVIFCQGNVKQSYQSTLYHNALEARRPQMGTRAALEAFFSEIYDITYSVARGTPLPWKISCASQRSTLINWGNRGFDPYELFLMPISMITSTYSYSLHS